MQCNGAMQHLPLLARGFATHAPALASSSLVTFLGLGGRPTVPLTESLTVIGPAPISAPTTAPTLETSILESGMSLSTLESMTPISSISIAIAGGTATETPEFYGVNRVLQAMAFKATANRTTFRLTRELERMGAIGSAVVRRDSLVHTIQFPKTHAAEAVELLMDSVLNAKLNLWEVNEYAKYAATSSAAYLKDPNHVLADILHRAAFDGPLGNPLYTDPALLKLVTPDKMFSYLSETVVPGSLMIGGTGVQHRLIKSLVSDLLPSIPAPSAITTSTSTYVGGSMSMMANLSSSHLGVAFPVPGGRSSPKSMALAYVTAAVLDESRTPLPRSTAPASAITATSCLHATTGLISLYASSTASEASAMVDAVAKKLKAAAAAVSPDALAIAKAVVANKVGSAFATSGSSSARLATQAIGKGSLDGAEFYAALEAVTSADVSAFVSSALKAPLTFATYGALSNMPRSEAIAKKFV